jgi:hypothetical protein
LTGGVVAVEPTPTSFVPGVDGPEDETTPTDVAELPTTTMTPAGVPTEQMPPTLADTVPAEGTVTVTATTTTTPPTLTATVTATTTPTAVGTMRPTRVPTMARPPDEPAPPKPRPGVTIAVVPKVSVVAVPRPTAPSLIPGIMTATLRITGRTCPRDGFDPHLMYPAWDVWETTCTEPGAFSFGVTVNRSAPGASYSKSLSVAAGAVGETIVDAPSTIQIQQLKTGYSVQVFLCYDSLGSRRWLPLDAGPGDVIECTLYAVPQDDDVIIDGWVGVCDASPELSPTAPLPSRERRAELCRGSVFAGGPVTIMLRNADGTVTQSATTIGGSYSAGRERDEYVLYDLPPGTYTLTATVPKGFGFAFLDSCVTSDATASSVPASGAPSSYTVTVGPGGRDVHCTWYLVRSS